MTKTYAELSKNMKPASIVVRAVQMSNVGEALDIGAGSLRNSKFLLDRGFKVTAIDKDPIMIQNAMEIANDRLHVEAIDFRDFTYTAGKYDLIVSINSLPFLPREALLTILPKIKMALADGGVLCITLFGERDGWRANNENMSFFSRDEVQDLFNDLHTIMFIEENFEGETIQREPKYWHVFKLIAKRAE